MKYYSEKLSKKGVPALFDTEKELREAEERAGAKEAGEKRKAEERKAEALAVENAYKKAVETRKKAHAEIEKADGEYIDKRNAFIEKYGSFHMTYTDNCNLGNHESAMAFVRVSDEKPDGWFPWFHLL